MKSNDLKIIKSLLPEKITSIEENKLGVSNSNYLINKKYFIRIKKSKSEFYNRNREYKILNKISKLNISDKLIKLDKNGNKISYYINDAEILNPINKEKVIKSALILKKLHNSNIKINNNFNALKRYLTYKNNTKNANFKHEKIVIKKIKNIYKKYPLILCHNDVVDNNFLFTKTKTFLIDYEFASNNVFLFDLASFISENTLEYSPYKKTFLDAYKLPKKYINDLKYMIYFTNLLWYYWAKNMYKISKKRIYKIIEKDKLNKIEKNIKDFI